jgi:hypothetical protein
MKGDKQRRKQDITDSHGARANGAPAELVLVHTSLFPLINLLLHVLGVTGHPLCITQVLQLLRNKVDNGVAVRGVLGLVGFFVFLHLFLLLLLLLMLAV